MGDMKTPDFDDLLAAFDIPDIDAKEAIQSAPEAGPGGGPSLRPPSPPDPAQTPQADAPVVSVIVKNRVCPGMYGEEGDEKEEEGVSLDGEAPGGAESAGGGALSGPPQLAPSEQLVHNGFEAADLAQGPTQSNGELWSPSSPMAAGGGEGGVSGARSAKHRASAAGGLRPPPMSGRKGLQTQQQQQEQEAHADDVTNRAKVPGPDDDDVTSSHASSLFPSPVSLPLPALSSRFIGPLLSPPPQPFNGGPSPAARRFVTDDDEDSEPDLGSPPLVIQESPDSPMCSPPKLPRRRRSSPFPSPSSSTSSLPAPPPPSSQTGEGAPAAPRPPSPTSSSARPPLAASQAWLSSPSCAPPRNNDPHVEERNPEHVIEERDSPESPEPEAAAPALGSSSVSAPGAQRSSSPAQAPLPPAQRGPAQGPGDQDPMESQTSGKPHLQGGTDAQGEGEEEEEDEEEEEEEEEEEGMEVEEEGEKPSAAATPPVPSAPGSSAGPARPLKVRIKTVKTPTGSITRTVTRVAPRGAAGAPDGGEPGGRKVVSRPKRPGGAPPLGQPQRSAKGGVFGPVSTLQDASTAMLVAASKAQSKMAAERPRASAAAVVIAKAAALPSVSLPGVHAVGQKAVNGGPVGTAPPGQPPTLPPAACKPASIVSSAGAVISRSQSSLVEAFNKILNSKNLLPSYRPDLAAPPPAEWALAMPAAGYRCLECGDAFALDRSLARHYDRRSLRIEVTCNHCAKRLAFFNKCSLLLHAREHKERGLVMQCSHLVMRPITVEQMIAQQDTTPIGMLSLSFSSKGVSVAPSPGKEESPAPSTGPAPRPSDGPQVLLPLPCKKAEPLQYINNRCPECRTQFSGRAELVAHFQEVKAASNTSCTQCTPPMLLPNPCSAVAHQRLHKHRAPHVCPECGGIARQASFHTHLTEACLHYARRIGYRCSSCQVVFGGLNSVKSHIQTAHCEVFHKCPNCPMAFKSAPSAQGHISTQHPALTGAQAKMIYKCVMCETVFTQKALLYVHFDTHLAKQKVHVFKCPDCTKLYAQRGSMMEHMKAVHRGPSVKQEAPVAVASSPAPPPPLKGRSSLKLESSDGEEWGREQEEEQEEEDGEREGEPGDRERAKGGGQSSSWSCGQCHTRYTDKENYITHMAEQHSKLLKKFPCSLCEGSFSSSSSLRRHVRVKHKGIKRAFQCTLCPEGKRTFSSRLILEKHVQDQHGAQPPSTRPARETQKRGRVTDGADSSSEQDGAFSAAGGGASAEEDDSGLAANGGTSASAAKRSRGAASEPEGAGFRCSPCGFSTEDRAEFLQHIPRHRGDAAAQQCVQCGACFASGSSLSRHRFISHRVRDAHARPAARDDTDAARDGRRGDPTADPSAAAASPGETGLAEGEGGEGAGQQGCRVCGRRFEKVSDLNTHLRTHGMAFITKHKTDKPT